MNVLGVMVMDTEVLIEVVMVAAIVAVHMEFIVSYGGGSCEGGYEGFYGGGICLWRWIWNSRLWMCLWVIGFQYGYACGRGYDAGYGAGYGGCQANGYGDLYQDRYADGYGGGNRGCYGYEDLVIMDLVEDVIEMDIVMGKVVDIVMQGGYGAAGYWASYGDGSGHGDSSGGYPGGVSCCVVLACNCVSLIISFSCNVLLCFFVCV